jgi:two-component system response regulator
MRGCDILFAEDSDTDAELTLQAIRRADSSWTVLRARDGQEALDTLFGIDVFSSVRLILLDLHMPRANGIDMLRRLKDVPLAAAIPVVMLTSSDSASDVALSYSFGANSYIVKPGDSYAFVSAVEAVCHYWLRLNRTLASPTR